MLTDESRARAQSRTTDSLTTDNVEEVITPSHPYSESWRGEHELDHDGNVESDDDDDSSDYLSFDESDLEEAYPETKADREARAHERQLVLQAAGLIVTQNDKPPPRITRARSTKRRPAPAAPDRSSTTSFSSSKELPPVPRPGPEREEPEPDHATRLDDAFDRYESFKNTQGNRMSIASMETLSSSPTVSSFTSIPSPTKDTESNKSYSQFLHFLGRTRTPDGERRTTLNISAPIMNSSNDPSRSTSPAFGTVSMTVCWFITKLILIKL